MRSTGSFVVVLIASFSMGCVGEPDPDPVGSVSEEVVYGADDRRELYQITDPILTRLTTSSIVAPIDSALLDRSNPDDIRIRPTPTVRESIGQCRDAAFSEQPTAAYCSTTLIAPNLIVTAGHCFPSGCDGTSFVFGYHYEAAGRLSTIGRDDVYECRRVVVQRVESTTAFDDWAVIELDRPVSSDKQPVRVRREPLTRGEAVSIIGFGLGVPAKIDAGGSVTYPGAAPHDWFYATVDAFGGNSGSGIFDSTGRIVGILSGGNDDHVAAGGCNEISVLSDSTEEAELIGYAARAIDALCAAGEGGSLCDPEPASSCGDGVCDAGEAGACALDCGGGSSTGGAPPGSWFCPASSYGTSDGCDCGCGMADPDCQTAEPADVSGCGLGELCDPAGVCYDPETGPRFGDCVSAADDPTCGVPEPRLDSTPPGAIVGGCSATRVPTDGSMPWAIALVMCVAVARRRR